MMKTAKKLEAKKQKETDRKREEKDKKMNNAIYTWEHDIIPHWKSKQHDKKTLLLWSQGIPPRCRKKIWSLSIGNNLNITKGTFAECVRRVPPSLRTSNSVKRPESIAHDASIYSSYRKHRRNSSLDVLRENNEDHHLETTEEGEELSDQQVPSYTYSNNYSNNNKSAVDFESNHEEYGDIGLEDDDSTSQEEDDKILKDPIEISFLNKSIDEDILRTLPSLCVFQVNTSSQNDIDMKLKV